MSSAFRAGRFVAGAALLGAGLTGCYRYITVPPADTVPPGARVRVQLDDRGTNAVDPSIGPSVIALEGETMEWRPDSIVLSVRSAQTRSGERFAWTGLRAAFPPAAIERIERREFSRSRSVMLGAGAVAAAALVLKVAIDAAAGGTPGGGGPPPPMP
jgi:hypothetical protein